jgi:hypothetical protein
MFSSTCFIDFLYDVLVFLHCDFKKIAHSTSNDVDKLLEGLKMCVRLSGTLNRRNIITIDEFTIVRDLITNGLTIKTQNSGSIDIAHLNIMSIQQILINMILIL